MKVQNPIIGRSRGSAGGMTFCKNFDKNVARAKAFEVSNPKTAAQQNQRGFFKQVSGIVATVSEAELRSLFGIKPKAMSRRNALSKQIAAANSTVEGVKSVDFSKLNAIGSGMKVNCPILVCQMLSLPVGSTSFVWNLPSMSLADAFSGFEPSEGDTLTNMTNNSSIIFEEGEWMGDFEQLIQGNNYKYGNRGAEAKTWQMGGSPVIPQLSAADLGLSSFGDANVIAVVMDQSNNKIKVVNSNLKWSDQDGETSAAQFVQDTNLAYIYFSCEEKGNDVYSRGFGSFIIKTRAEKTGRNINE